MPSVPYSAENESLPTGGRKQEIKERVVFWPCRWVRRCEAYRLCIQTFNQAFCLYHSVSHSEVLGSSKLWAFSPTRTVFFLVCRHSGFSFLHSAKRVARDLSALHVPIMYWYHLLSSYSYYLLGLPTLFLCLPLYFSWTFGESRQESMCLIYYIWLGIC